MQGRVDLWGKSVKFYINVKVIVLITTITSTIDHSHVTAHVYVNIDGIKVTKVFITLNLVNC